MIHRDYAPNLSPVERPEVDDGSREELAEYYAAGLCQSCVKHNRDCPIDPIGPVMDCLQYNSQESKR